jgi:hypothetical protein
VGAGLAHLAAVYFACALVGAAPAGAQSDGWFEQRPFPDRSFTLDDLGVTDFDGDGDLDVFTTNHLSTQLLLANDGGGAFEDRLTEAGLNHTPAFPGWEDEPSEPRVDGPGLYLFRNGGLSVRLVGDAAAASGTLSFLAPVTITEAIGAQATVTQDTSTSPVRRVVSFSMNGDSMLRLRPESSALPVRVAIDGSQPLSEVFVGRRQVNPPGRQFTLYQRDRHGMGWADFNRDRHIDVLVTRGGVSGNIDRYRGAIQDELLLGNGSTFEDAIAGTGITKGTCRGRAAGAVDYNRDGLLDAFVDCFGSSPRLFRQRGNGTFKNVSSGMKRSRVKGNPFEWLDVDGSGPVELVSARRKHFVVYRRKGKRWERAQSLNGRHEANAQKLAVGDYDNDGDPDIYAAAKTGSALLVNHRGRFRVTGPKSVGLPSRAVTANWVDYDNDGQLDLHLVPGGLFRREPGGRFAHTGLAQPGPAVRALASWFDADADGARDVALAVRREGDGKWTSLSLLRNEGAAAHWLEVELEGAPGNREAVGAVVSAATPGRKQTQWVGQSEGSHLSQGHYRVYFGLGAATSAKLEVRWPDGRVQRLGAVDADRLVRVAHPG